MLRHLLVEGVASGVFVGIISYAFCRLFRFRLFSGNNLKSLLIISLAFIFSISLRDLVGSMLRVSYGIDFIHLSIWNIQEILTSIIWGVFLVCTYFLLDYLIPVKSRVSQL